MQNPAFPVNFSNRFVISQVLFCFVVLLLNGCGGAGAEKAAVEELKSLGATVLLQNERASSLVLSNMMGKEVDLEAALPLVPKLTKLESLILSGTKVTDDQLKIVGQLRSLGDLQLSDTSISDAGITHLTGLSNLTSIYVSRTKVTSASMPEFGKLSKLSTLGIDDTGISGGYESLHGLEGLTLLVAGKLKITDADADAIVKIPNLKRLDITGAEVTEEVVKKLQKGLPEVGL